MPCRCWGCRGGSGGGRTPRSSCCAISSLRLARENESWGYRRILALDFFTADLLNGTKACVLAVIEHGTRRIRMLGATKNPVQSWVVQQARSLLMDLEDAGVSVKFVLHDRGASFTIAFDAVFQAVGVRVVRCAV